MNDDTVGGSSESRRAYHSPARQRQAEQTRERIVAAGSEIVHSLPQWDWGQLTFTAVAERAGVGRRTVFRHFPTEVQLHDAVMQRLEEEAGVDYDAVTLDNVAGVASHVFASLQEFASLPPKAPLVPTFYSTFHRRRHALVRAIEEQAPDWPEAQRNAATAVVDLLWDVTTFERLVTSWRLDRAAAAQTIAWTINLVAAAVAAGNFPLGKKST
jgi:AcrR family transcriptional regulator